MMSKAKKGLVAGLMLLCFVSIFAAPVAAAQYQFTLFEEDTPITFFVDPIGGPAFSVYGFMPAGGKLVIFSGVCVVEGPTAHFGITLQNAMMDYSPVIWEFVIDIATMTGGGSYKWLVGEEWSGQLLLGPSPVVTESRSGVQLSLGAK